MKTTITKKGQIVIPVRLRRKFDIKAGTTFHVNDDGENIILTPVTSDYVSSLRGLAGKSGALKALEKERKRERENERDNRI